MATRINSRQKCLISSAVHPEYRDTVRTYPANQRCALTEIPYCTETGTTPLDAVEKYIDTDTSCVVIQYPNFFGSLENIESISDIVRKNNSLLVVVITEPISLGLLKPPGKLGADIVAGE